MPLVRQCGFDHRQIFDNLITAIGKRDSNGHIELITIVRYSAS